MKLGFLSIFLMSYPLISLGEFTGELKLEPEGCEKERACYVKYPLHFMDSKGIGWEAKAGLKTDGASIPAWAQSFIGKPYDKSYIKAAVVHDHYCDRHVRPWRETHRVFYDMLRSLDVPVVKSKLMYYAVYVGGPKWVELVPGNACGSNCINTFNSLKDSEKYLYAPEQYSAINKLDVKLKKMEALLNESDLSLDEIDKIAISEDPDNFYYKNGDTYPYDPKVGIDR